MMKHRVFLAAILLTALAFSQSAKAYDFSAVAPSGQTLYYNIVGGNAQVTSQNSSSPYYFTYPTGALTIPDTVTYNGTTYSVTSIGDNAFNGDTSLISVTIGGSVTSIGNFAFNGCSGLMSVTIPNSVTSIGDHAFQNCIGLTGSLTIPNSVTSIAYQAFYNCSGLTSVTIGGSVTTIGDRAFEDCSGLTSVTIGNSVTTIGDYAFYGCSGLTSVTIPNSVTSIGSYAFRGCTGLTSVTIGHSVTSIGNYAFRDCSGLTTVNYNADSCGNFSVGGSHPFYGCSNLTTVNLGNNVRNIPANFMYGASSLTSVTIGNSVTSIGYYAFRDCSGLTSVTIGGSVTTIADQAFANCNGMTEITCLATGAPTLGNNVFYNVPSTIPVYIPCASRASYVSLWNRERFSNFVETFLFTLDAQSADTTMGTVAITTSPTCSDSIAVVTATADSGYRFDHWSDGSTNNPYAFTVTSDTTIIAYFVREEEPEGITDANNDNVSVYARDGRIVVTGAEGESVQVFDITGRPVNSHSPLPTGVYMVKVGNLPIRKVVVLK